ncbi:MAG TPA: hypothetical protein PKD61_37970, partial [Polyangiaceae bacterium]|nr:hypothetical protein [Polyangiaceae bacterium]
MDFRLDNPPHHSNASGVMLASAPILVALCAALVCLLARGSVRRQQRLSIAGGVVLLLVSSATLLAVVQSGPLHTAVGDWRAPTGIDMRIDSLSAIVIFVASLIGLAALLWASQDSKTCWQPKNYHALHHFLMFGVVGALCTADLFNLYVWFEVMLIASFALLTSHTDPDRRRAAVFYVVPSVLGSVGF